MTKSNQWIKCSMAGLLFLNFLACSNDDRPSVISPTSSAIMNTTVGGVNQPNQVFIDLSGETQTAVNRSSWDLGFYNGDEFRVILNHSTSTLAYALAATELNSINANDTSGLGQQLDIDAIFGALQGPPTGWLANAATWLDAPSGDLDQTAIAAISANDNENKVYIINRGKNPDGSQRGWLKTKIMRSGDSYTLRFAEIASITFQEIQISKDSDYNFSFVSFDNGAVLVEPEANHWDIAFTTFTNLLPVGPGTSIPYLFKDFVIQNRNGLTVSEVSVADVKAYEDFQLEDTSTLTFSSEITTIGSSWRTVAQPGSPIPTGVKEDFYYVLKDTDRNTYKLRFTRMLNPESGERGFPQIQYDLLTAD